MTISIAVVGGGRLGTAIGRQLYAAGYPITGVCCRTKDSALRSASTIGTETAVTDPLEITPRARLVLITTPDDTIAETCDAIIKRNGFSDGTIILHCSGSLPSTILESARDAGMATGSFHPLQSFAAADTSGRNPFSGIVAAIEGDEQAVKTAQQLGDSLGATCFTIRTKSKSLYHAAAVVASNYLVSLIDIAFSFLSSAGIDRQDAVTILYPLINGTLNNIKTTGIPEALTGPIARGDIKTIEDHLNHIQTQNKELLTIYSHLGLHTIGLAVDKGTITSAQADALRHLLNNTINR